MWCELVSPATVNVGYNAWFTINTVDDSKLGIDVIEIISITKFINEKLTTLCHRFSSDYTHSRGVITKHFIDDVEVHCFALFELKSL